ncbi:MAG: chorismate mutase [Kiritimatiellae bacterium]|nr:chorismate mutase [Kiritimatiellia bacterium]
MDMEKIASLRREIDGIDSGLVALFKKRMETALAIGREKAAANRPVLDAGREREIFAKVTEESGEGLAMYAKILYSVLLDISRSYQTIRNGRETRLSRAIAAALAETPKTFPAKAVVACQGIEGAYSQQACDKLFPLASILYFNRFEGVFQAVAKGLCRYGILPIENSSYGSVNEVYDLMRRNSFFIARSIKMKVAHCLLAKPGTKLEDVKEVYSHEQAVGQCGAFLKSRPGLKVTVCENTAVAAKTVRESPRGDVAAISSRNCAEIYGLEVLSEGISDSDNNYTRFICISKKLEIYPGADKVSLMLALPHRPGALYTMISKFSALGLNLTKLESRPIPGSDFEFMFYFDMDASIYSEEVVRLLGELEERSELFVFLGAYGER